MRRALAALVLLAACRKPVPACFKVQSIQGIDKLRSGEDQLIIFEAFVMADPPDEPQALLAAVAHQCGSLPEPQAAVSNVHWMVFKETWDTPRTLVPGFGKHDTLDHHQDDEILELQTDRGSGCNGSTSWVFLRNGAIVADSWTRLPLPADAGPPPSWCAK